MAQLIGIVELLVDGIGRVEKLLDLLIGEFWSEIAAALVIELVVWSWIVEQLVPDQQGDSECSTGVSCRGLDPDLIERSFSEDSAIGHAIECDSTGEAQFVHSCGLVDMVSHFQHGVFGDGLDAGCDVHVFLSEW